MAPADEPHGTQHSKLSALLEAHVSSDYEVASDMLTRTSTVDDLAPDASVFPLARDAETGQRQLEELAFEIASTEALSHAARKAQKLAARGVRRIFAVDVTRRRAVEWSKETDSWSILDHGTVIEDKAFAAPLPVKALVSAAKTDDAMARALLAKRNPILVDALSEQNAEGRLGGKLEALVTLLAARGIPPTDVDRQQLAAFVAVSNVDALIRAAVHCNSIADLLQLAKSNQ